MISEMSLMRQFIAQAFPDACAVYKTIKNFKERQNKDYVSS